jgi:3-oxoacyl-[acyl-carrier protein] reductase
MNTLQNKTALVTGASKGIGRATALALAKAGAHVVVHYGRSAQEAESLVAEIQAKGGRADAISADLGTPDGASLLATRVRSIVGDRLDVLVLNAGVSKAARVADHTVEDFDNLLRPTFEGHSSWCSNCYQFLVRAQTLLLSLPP